MIETQIGKKKQSRYLADQTDCFDIHRAFPDSQIGNQFGKSLMQTLDRSTHDVFHRHKSNTCNCIKPVFDMYLALSGSYRQTWVLDTLNSNCAG